ncbi:MAG: hypothetical protein FJW40_08745 [Acidobacteria bacterium]|nr:hypothetical protein [Acidobacteriota bacterium]
MAQTATVSVRRTAEVLQGNSGLDFSLASVTAGEQGELQQLPPARVVAQNVVADVAEKGPGVTYPVVYLFCDKVENRLREKFRTFSGKAHLTMDVRVTDHHLGTIEDRLRLYVDAATQVLDNHRGDWGEGMYFAGGYEVTFSPVKRGGKNYVQTAKVQFDLDVSLD